MDSGENREEKADMGLRQIQAPLEVFLHLLHVVTSSSFQPSRLPVELLFFVICEGVESTRCQTNPFPMCHLELLHGAASSPGEPIAP